MRGVTEAATTLRENDSALAEIEILTKRQEITASRLEQELELWARPKREVK